MVLLLTRDSLQIYCMWSIDWYNLFNCEELIDILCLDCGFLN